MKTWTSYPKVYNFGHRAVQDIFNEPVVVQEKVDGSQFSFGLIDGVLRIRSKGVEMNIDAPERMFNKAAATVAGLGTKLTPGWTYRGEYLQNPKHNVLAYDRVPAGNIILFDITIGEESYLSPAEVAAEGQRLGLEVVPTLFEGRIGSLEQFRSYLDTISVLGGQKIEGVVAKNYQRFGIDGRALFGKFVSETFKEVHAGEWKKANPQQNDILSQLIERYRTPARWAKAVQHLRDAGKLTDSPKDIGPLLLEVQADVQAEEIEAIKQYLWTWAWPHVRRGITAGLPQWYKDSLLEVQFAPRTDETADQV